MFSNKFSYLENGSETNDNREGFSDSDRKYDSVAFKSLLTEDDFDDEEIIFESRFGGGGGGKRTRNQGLHSS